MDKVSQYGDMGTTAPVGPNVTNTPTNQDLIQEEAEQNQLRQQEIRMINQQIILLRNKLNSLQKAAQITPIKQNEDQFDDLNRQEEVGKDDQKHNKDIDTINKLQQQNQQNQQQMSTQMSNMSMQSSKWVKSENANAKILFDSKIAILCDVAATPRQQASGLQAYTTLPEGRGLWFPQSSSRVAAFHMGNVKFPIDIIFANEGRINKIIANVTPGQFGSWSSICTDVIEVNAGWCRDNEVMVGDIIETPLDSKKLANSEIEHLVNKLSNRTSHDPLRSLTEASDEDNFEEELLTTFPFLRQAKENRMPGGNDSDQTVRTNPLDRFEHNTLPDEFSPFGDGNGADVDPFSGMGNPNDSGDSGGFSSRHFDYTRGFDPSLANPERKRVTPISPDSDGLLAPIRPSAAKTKMSIDPQILVEGSLQLFNMHPPDWSKEEGGEHEEMAVITASTLDNWIDGLGFERQNEEALRQIMFTDNYKNLLGEALQSRGLIKESKLFDSDLLLYR